MIELVVLTLVVIGLVAKRMQIKNGKKVLGFAAFDGDNPCGYRAVNLMSQIKDKKLLLPKVNEKKWKKFILQPLQAMVEIVIGDYHTVIFFKPHFIAILPAITAFIFGCRIVYDYDEWDPYTIADQKSMLKTKLMELATFISLKIGSAFLYSNTKIKREFISDKKNTIYLPNGVDTTLFKPYKNQDYKKLVFLGSLHKVDHLIPYFTRIPGGYKLLVVGRGKMMQKLFDALEEANVSYENVYCTREEIPSVIGDSGVALATFEFIKSIDYACNMKVFEYMGAGKVIVATDIGDLKKLGKILVVKTPDEFEKLLKDDKLERFKDYGEQNAKIAKERYDWQILSKELGNFIKKVS